MKSRMNWFIATAIAITVVAIFSTTANRSPVHAQGAALAFQGVPHCTMGKASGTYGYQMRGQIIGVGPFLVNGLFTHNYDGTMDADVQLVVGQQSFPASGTGGKWTINDDCTGSGTFAVPALNLQVTYNFIATDGGNQIDLLNTNAGVLLQGAGRRIAPPGKAPSCNNGTVLGSYGYRLDGSLPNVPGFIIAGTFTQTSAIRSITSSRSWTAATHSTSRGMNQASPHPASPNASCERQRGQFAWQIGKTN